MKVYTYRIVGKRIASYRDAIVDKRVQISRKLFVCSAHVSNMIERLDFAVLAKGLADMVKIDPEVMKLFDIHLSGRSTSIYNIEVALTSARPYKKADNAPSVQPACVICGEPAFHTFIVYRWNRLIKKVNEDGETIWTS
jgi:hypothetical protein